MDERKHLIFLHGENKTKEIQMCKYNPHTQRYEVTFSSGKTYPYGYASVTWYREPQVLDPACYQVISRGKLFSNIQSIFSFRNGREEYWHIVFSNGVGRTYDRNELEIIISCLEESASKDCLAYLRKLAAINELKSEDGEVLLKKQYENLTFVGKDTALAIYLNPEEHPIQSRSYNTIIFPFGGNASQFKAVRNALSNQMSVIQGPPGTGKTQTILNIIANLLLREQTVEIVSNNNSAVINIYEKLASSKYCLDFLVAPLGRSNKKRVFVESQNGLYPDLSAWEQTPEGLQNLRTQTTELAQELSTYFEKQERLACAKQEISALELEIKYFDHFCEEYELVEPVKPPRKGVRSSTVLQILQECERFLEQRNAVTFWHKAKSAILFGLFEWNYYDNDISVVVTYLLKLFYSVKHQELLEEIDYLHTTLNAADTSGKMSQLTQLSMDYLRGILFQRYGGQSTRKCFSDNDLWQNPSLVLSEYPIVLSTTFSSRSSLKNVTYDYIIMDEASQVDLATGALALSCAKNAVIVGDLKQLSNVITGIKKKESDAIFSSHQLPEGYSFTNNSFLRSICSVIPNIPQTLLREHYRCHPKIINFCNQKFYNNELIIMTEDHDEPDVLSVLRTVVGNHRRGHINQRQIDVTIQEVLPRFSDILPTEVGIIAPYRDQANALATSINEHGIEIDTVHKFQGREKDAIILTTVDDVVTDFSDNPYLLNVAISRAKKKLCLVSSGNEQPQDSNVQDLISYIEYNNFEVINSKIYSVFDFLYQQYTAQRIAFLSKHRRISQFDSENLMYASLIDLLAKHSDIPLNVVCHQSVRLLIRNLDKLTDEECQYVSHPSTHVDFLIYNRVTKAPILAIEVDGFHYHKSGTSQAQRDKLKDSIFDKYQIPLLRFPTNGSSEVQKIEQFLFGSTS